MTGDDVFKTQMQPIERIVIERQMGVDEVSNNKQVLLEMVGVAVRINFGNCEDEEEAPEGVLLVARGLLLVGGLAVEDDGQVALQNGHQVRNVPQGVGKLPQNRHFAHEVDQLHQRLPHQLLVQGFVMGQVLQQVFILLLAYPELLPAQNIQHLRVNRLKIVHQRSLLLAHCRIRQPQPSFVELC